jgi:hypothetical protein
MEVQLHTSNLKPGGEWSPLRPVRFTCGESAASTQQNKGWVDPKGQDGRFAEDKTFLSLPAIEYLLNRH